MLTGSLAVFGVAALGGLVLAGWRFTKAENPPIPLALAHGALAATGLVVLIIAVVTEHLTGKPVIALVIFVVAALGGFTLIAIHLKKKIIPAPLVLIHALAAVAAFVLLLLAVLAL